MPFIDAVDVAETYNDISFPILSIKDLIPWAKELHEQKKIVEGSMIPSDLNAVDRWKVIRSLASPPDVDELRFAVSTPEGIEKVLFLSLIKSGKNEEEANKLLESIPSGVGAELALFVSGFYKRKLPEQPSISPNPTAQTLDNEGNQNPLAPQVQTLSSQ